MSVEKTKQIERKFVEIGLLHPNPENPNVMSERQFNLLYDNIEKMGLTDPILVRPHPEHPGAYRIIGGQHRWEVAKMQGFTEVPVTIVDHADFDEDAEKFQIVRHNIIGGQMDAAKFAKLVEGLNEKYNEEVAAELFGFTDEAEFRKLINATAKSLPKELQKQFKDAAKEVKTIDDLAKLLNSLFSKYGDTLPHGYMFVDFGGAESVWLRMQTGQLKDFRTLAEKVRERGKGLDHLFAHLIRLMNTEGGEEILDAWAKDAPDVQVSDEAPYATLDFLDE